MTDQFRARHPGNVDGRDIIAMRQAEKEREATTMTQQTEMVWEMPADHIWKQLFGGPVAQYKGESWQYMGSERISGNLVHTFRHRCHPATYKPMYFTINDDEAN